MILVMILMRIKIQTYEYGDSDDTDYKSYHDINEEGCNHDDEADAGNYKKYVSSFCQETSKPVVVRKPRYCSSLRPLHSPRTLEYLIFMDAPLQSNQVRPAHRDSAKIMRLPAVQYGVLCFRHPNIVIPISSSQYLIFGINYRGIPFLHWNVQSATEGTRIKPKTFHKGATNTVCHSPLVCHALSWFIYVGYHLSLRTFPYLYSTLRVVLFGILL